MYGYWRIAGGGPISAKNVVISRYFLELHFRPLAADSPTWLFSNKLINLSYWRIAGGGPSDAKYNEFRDFFRDLLSDRVTYLRQTYFFTNDALPAILISSLQNVTVLKNCRWWIVYQHLDILFSTDCVAFYIVLWRKSSLEVF